MSILSTNGPDVVGDDAKDQDPRPARTRAHVLSTVHDMLERREGLPLTFTTIAVESNVARRTLYKHWGTVESLMADALNYFAIERVDLTGMSGKCRLRNFLLSARDGLALPIVASAILSLMTEAKHSPEGSAALDQLDTKWITEFTETVAPITTDQYAQLLGPILYVEYATHQRASDALIDTLVERGAAILNLE